MEVGPREIDEESAIGELLTLDYFQNYYNSLDISNIKPIHWVVDPRLTEGSWGSAGWGKRGGVSIPIVTLQEAPVRVEHVIRIAHEIQHLLLDKEGFPRIVCSNLAIEELTTALKNMVQDPLINLRLVPHGFDVRRDHIMEMLGAYRELLIENYPTSPTGEFTRLLWTVNFVRNILRWETAVSDGHEEDNEFQKWFHELYPDIAKKGKKLLKLVRGTGYKTPEDHNRLFNKISKRYMITLDFLPIP